MVVSTRRNLMGVLTVASMCAGCADSSSGPADTRERAVYTTFYPTTYFAEQIAQGTVPVVCPLPAGEDPIFEADLSTPGRRDDSAAGRPW